MATDFPATGLDTFTDVATAGTILAATTNNMQDPIAAIEIKLGVNSSAVTSSIDYLLKSASSTDPGHLHTTSGISGQIAVAQGGTGASSAGAARTALGVVIGTDVQAYDADLTELAGLADSDGNFIVGSASGWVAESGATARTSIGLGSVENTALSTWAGTTNITTLGTIGTGVWSGTAVADTYVANDLTISGGTVNSSVIGGSTAAAGTFTQLDVEATGDLRLQDTTGGEYVGWDAPGTVSSSYMMTLPAAIGAVGEVLKINNTDGTLEWGEAGGGNDFTAKVTIAATDNSDPLLKITQSGSAEGLWVTDATAASFTKITNNILTLAAPDGVNPKPIIMQTKLSGGTGYFSMGRTIFTDTTKALVIGNLLGNQLEIRNKTTWYTDSAADGTITWTRNNDHPLGFIIGTDALSQIGHIDLKAGATGTASAVAYLAMESSDSTMYYLFFDNDGDLRMDSSKPVANGQGTVVGTQS